jgi:hypothetical protein
MASSGKPSSSETCIGLWSLFGKGVNSGRLCTGIHIVILKNQDPNKAVYSECRGLQIVVAVEDTDNQQDSQTLKYQPRHSKLQEEDSGLLIRLSNVWRQRFGTLRDMVVYYRHSPNASHGK